MKRDYKKYPEENDNHTSAAEDRGIIILAVTIVAIVVTVCITAFNLLT